MFNQAGVKPDPELPASWRENLYRMYKSSSQHMRVAVYGCKHDASTFETLLQEICNMVQLVGEWGWVDEGGTGRWCKAFD